MSRRKVLLINGEGVQARCFAKGLKDIDCKVSAICNARISQGYFTRYFDEKYLGPDIGEEKKFFDFLIKHLHIHNYDIIIPMEDSGAEFLSKYKNEIENRTKIIVAIPDYPTFDNASDKKKLMEICQEHGITHPRTISIDNNTIGDAISYIKFPALIKPDHSAGARGIEKVNSEEDIKKHLPYLLSKYGNCTLQQFIEQPPYYYNVMLYRGKNGKILGQTVIKIRRYFPLRGGSSCYSETIKNQYLVDECSKLLDVLDWHGFADFDILEDKNTGDALIIEINPRVPSSLQASYAAGINFPEIYIRDYFNEKIPEYTYKEGMQIRWFGLDFMWFLMSPERFKFKPSWFNFWGKNVSYHDGSWSDPLPMLVGCIAGLKNYLNPEFRKSKLKNNHE